MSRVDLRICRYPRTDAIPDFDENLREWVTKQGYIEIGVTNNDYLEMLFTLEEEEEGMNNLENRVKFLEGIYQARFGTREPAQSFCTENFCEYLSVEILDLHRRVDKLRLGKGK